MDIQVRTDYHVAGDEDTIAYVREEVAAGLASYSSRITSVHVHLSEASGARKGPHDLLCTLEVRPARHAPVVVHRHAPSKDELVRSAVEGARTALERMFGRLDARHPGAKTIRCAG